MMKYPIGTQSFEQLRKDGYVDKTALIYRLITTGRIYFLSRPPALRQESAALHAQELFPWTARAFRSLH